MSGNEGDKSGEITSDFKEFAEDNDHLINQASSDITYVSDMGKGLYIDTQISRGSLNSSATLANDDIDSICQIDVEQTEMATSPNSIFSATSMMTVDGIDDKLGFSLCCLAIFVADMTRGILFPSMWNLVQTLGGDEILLGYTSASFAMGRTMSLPLFGYWSTKFG